MKHQLFKKGTHVVLLTNPNIAIIGKVKDSTIVRKRILAEDIFNILQEAIELEVGIVTVYENSDMSPKFIDDAFFIEDLVENMNGIILEFEAGEGKIYASILDLTVPSGEFKNLYYTLKQGAKQI